MTFKLDPARFIEYTPRWPSYRAQRLTDGVIACGTRNYVLADHGMVAYRLATMVRGRELAVWVPVPADYDEPLSSPDVVAMIADAVNRV